MIHISLCKRFEQLYINILIQTRKEKRSKFQLMLFPKYGEYMAFMLGKHLTIIDSFHFVSSSLEKLMGNLPRETFKYTFQVFQNEELDLMAQKGVYPYNHMDCFEIQ